MQKTLERLLEQLTDDELREFNVFVSSLGDFNSPYGGVDARSLKPEDLTNLLQAFTMALLKALNVVVHKRVRHHLDTLQPPPDQEEWVQFLELAKKLNVDLRTATFGVDPANIPVKRWVTPTTKGYQAIEPQ